MKTPKAPPKLERNALSTPSVKIGKNKKSGLQAKLDANRIKLALKKGNPTVDVKNVKNVLKNAPNPKANGSPGKKMAKSAPTSPAGAHVAKKRKSNEAAPNLTPQGNPQTGKKSKKEKVVQSPEVQLGLKIEKLLESPKGGKQPGAGAGKKKQKGPKPAGGQPQAQAQKPQAQPSSPGQGKKRKRNRKGKSGSPQVAVQNDSAQQGKQKQKQKPNVRKEKAPRVDEDAPIEIGDFPKRSNVESALKALLTEVNQRREKTPALLGDSDPIQVVVNFFKSHPGVRRIQRILLPHSHHGPDPDVIFIATDLKKAKEEPEESIEHHATAFREQGVTSVTEIIPWKKLTKEYTQYEEKRKLANRGDIFLIDSRLAHRWPAIMRKSVLRKKAPIPLRTHPLSDLKKNVEAALRKTTVLSKDNTLHLSVVVGHSKSKVKDVADNVATVVAALIDTQRFVGGLPNIRQVVVKTAKSDSFPIYTSTVTPNAVEKPKAPKKKKAEVVTGEVTSAGVTVAVHPDGSVKVKSKDVDLNETEHDTSPKKKKTVKKLGDDSEDEDEDDDEESDIEEDDDDDEEDESDDDIDPIVVKKFKSANKASDDDETSDEEEIDKAEQEFLLALRKQQDALETEAKAANAKAKKEASKSGKPVKIQEVDDDDDEEEDDESGEESEDDEDEEEDDSDDSEVPDLIPTKKPQAIQPQKGKGKPQGGKPQGGKFQGGKPGQNGQLPKWKQQGNFQKGKGKGNSPQQKGGKGSPHQQKGGPHQQKGGQGGKGKPFQKRNQKPNKQQGSPKGRYFNMKAGGKNK